MILKINKININKENFRLKNYINVKMTKSKIKRYN